MPINEPNYSVTNALSVDNETIENVELQIVQEAPLQININGQPFTVTMRTPGDDEEMVRGLLYAEQVIETWNEQIDYNVVKKSEGIITAVNIDIPANMLGKGYKSDRTFLSVSSCGICGKKELEDMECTEHTVLHSSIEIDKKQVSQLFSELKNGQKLFKQTGGSHGAAIFDKNFKCIAVFEDIGRHNAVDKVIGYLQMKQHIKEAEILLVSGRISYEIVLKAYRAEIPFLFAVSAPSSLAVELADDLGITLLGFCRDKRFTCYTNCEKFKK